MGGPTSGRRSDMPALVRELAALPDWQLPRPEDGLGPWHWPHPCTRCGQDVASDADECGLVTCGLDGSQPPTEGALAPFRRGGPPNKSAIARFVGMSRAAVQRILRHP